MSRFPLVFSFLLLLDGAVAQNFVGRQLEALFADPAFYRAAWGVKVESLASGEIIYEKDADRFFVPASNMKLLTAAAVVEQFQGDHRFETRLATDGEVGGGRLRGNLFILGGGDPSLGGRFFGSDPEDLSRGDPRAVFVQWAQQLKSLGIRRIDGDLIGEDGVFEATPLGQGWAWDYLAYGYAAPISGLSFNENVVLLRIQPAEEVGRPALLEVIPRTDYLQVDNQLQTAGVEEEPELSLERTWGSRHLLVKGKIPLDRQPFYQSASVPEPTLFCVSFLRQVLQEEGIQVRGGVRRWESPSPPDALRILWVHRSPPLDEILKVFLKISQNLYGEMLIRHLDPLPRGKSFARGRRRVEAVLRRAGVPGDSYQLMDGSGLSRYNYITPELLVRLLRYLYRSPHRERFIGFLPVAGVDGTIRGRLLRTAAEGKVQAKTGTLSNVRALSGYVENSRGEVLVFSMIVNHYTQPRPSAEYLQDRALEILVNHSAGPP